ncbi:MAG: DNA polymerase II large subunit, partial [Candidatus Micrarchaeota archaeon]|nr:DNA polymerase II large subunit [Candidatus Micrarchaeota archaeon]
TAALRQWLKKSGRLVKEWFDVKEAGVTDLAHKSLLETLGVPHTKADGRIILNGDLAQALWLQLGVMNAAQDPADAASPIEFVRKLCPVPVRDKAGVFVGTSMGRPEKSRERKMQPAVNVLFPVGMAGGKLRDVTKAAAGKEADLDVQIRVCTACKQKTWQNPCPSCQQSTVAARQCTGCGKYSAKAVCSCGAPTISHTPQRVSFADALAKAAKQAQFKPDALKGVIGLISANKTPENLAKGILRAKRGLSVFRDGTCRVDATEIPITHFVPAEIGLTVGKCRELGYETDIHSNAIERDEQTVELLPQDVILSEGAGAYAVKVANFVDDELVYVYGLSPFYQAEKPKDLVGQQVICIAPHTSAGITARIIGFSP